MQLTNAMFILTGIILIISLDTGNFAVLVLGFVVGGLSYGGVTPTNSAFVSSYFGKKNYPENFSVINTNLMIASFGSTIAGSLYDTSQSYLSTVAMILVLGVLGILVSAGISMCDKKTMSAQKHRSLT